MILSSRSSKTYQERVDGSELDVEEARLDQRRQTRCVLVDKTFEDIEASTAESVAPCWAVAARIHNE